MNNSAYRYHSKLILWFYLIAIFCLANGAFFTWLFKGTPLSMWRQIIWMSGLIIIAYTFPITKKIKSFRSIFRWHLIALYFIIISALISYAVYGFNPTRLAYSIWIYFSGLPFILLPFFISKFRIISAKKFYQIFTFLGIFMTIGLCIDYATNGSITSAFLISSNESIEGLINDKRYCFLSEAPTTFGVYYCFCLICTIMTIYNTNNACFRIILFITTLSYIAASWVTGSRQIVAVLILSEIIGFSYYLFRSKTHKKKFLIASIIITILALPTALEYATNQDNYNKRYSSSALSKDTRSENWMKGYRETVIENPVVFLFGHGASYIQGQKASPKEIVGSHYENTLFSRLSELGIGGLILLLFPVFYLLGHWKHKSLFYILILSINIAFLFTCYVSPNGVHQTTQMIMYMATGMIICADYFKEPVQHIK